FYIICKVYTHIIMMGEIYIPSLKFQSQCFCIEPLYTNMSHIYFLLFYVDPMLLLKAGILLSVKIGVSSYRVSKGLFEKYRTLEDYLAVTVEELQQDIRSFGLYKNKAKNIQKLCRSLIDEYEGKVPNTHEELVSLAGVGRKTANVVMSVAFHEPAIAVDTHIERVSKRLGICRWKDSVLEV